MNTVDFSKIYHLSDEEFSNAKDSSLFPYFVKVINNNKKYICCMKSDEKNTYNIISTYIKIVKKYIDSDSKKVKFLIEYDNGIETAEIYADRSVLSRNGIEEIINYGVEFDTQKHRYLLKYLMFSEQNALVEYSHTQLGWGELNGKNVFKSGKLISADESCAKSAYFGNLDLAPSGSREKWFEIVKTEVIGNIPLTTVMLAGFASPILGYLNQKYDLGSVLFNLSNSSSKGKTTAAMLATSVFGNPAMNKSTLITFNATNNALVNFAAQCNSHTIALDEAVISTASDVTKQLYTLCSGRDKLRLNTDSELKDAATFSSFIISTAEFDLIPDSATNGIRARVFELNDTFTTSAENSVKIKSIVAENYGFAGAEFVEFLLKEKINDIEKDYLKCQSELMSEYNEEFAPCKKGELTERVFSKLAILLQTAIYFEKCFGIKIKGNFIEYLKKIEKSVQGNSDRSAFLLECIKRSVGDNASKYITNPSNAFSGALGKISTDSKGTKIIITVSEANRIFEVNNIENPKNLLQQLKKDKILLCEKDRLYKRIQLCPFTHVKQHCYEFIVDMI